MIKLSDYIMKRIAEQGVGHVFTMVGGGAMHLNDSLNNFPGIQVVCNLHEQASAIAAEAYARVTNNLGVAVVTTGPGGTNAVTGLAAAWLDSTPCLFVSGQVKRADIKGDRGVRQLGVQEVDIISIVGSITKYAVTVMDPSTIRYHMDKAIHLAKSGRPGPVWIDVPLDVQAAMIDPDGLRGYMPEESAAGIGDENLKDQVAKVVELLRSAERPVLLAGNGIRLAGAEAEFRTLVEQISVPVLTTWLGIDLIPDDHPLFAGRPGALAPRGANFALQNSDLLIVLGARLDMAMIAYAPEKLARGARKVMVDIDDTEIRKFGTVIDHPICADAGAFIRELLKQSGSIPQKDSSPWLARCREWKQKYPVVLPEHRNEKSGVSTYFFTEVLCREMTGSDVVVPGSSGTGIEIFLHAFSAKEGQRVFHARGLGAMGFGLPAAIGACLASGRRRTVSVDGDGGFQLNIQELEIARRLNLPIKFFVISNQGYACIRASQQNYFHRLTGADASSGLTLPDLLRVASAYGVGTARITADRDLREQVREVLQTEGVVVCEVVSLPDEPRAPRISSVQKEDGSFVSKPLEDLWPFLDREEFLANMIVDPLGE